MIGLKKEDHELKESIIRVGKYISFPLSSDCFKEKIDFIGGQSTINYSFIKIAHV